MVHSLSTETFLSDHLRRSTHFKEGSVTPLGHPDLEFDLYTGLLIKNRLSPGTPPPSILEILHWSFQDFSGRQWE